MLRRVEELLPWAPVAAIFVVILYEAIFEKAGSLILPGAAIGAVAVTAGLVVMWCGIRAVLWIALALARPWTNK
jgi:hypothetical protein